MNFYGRTEGGWRAAIWAEGDWTDLLMAEPKPRVIDRSSEAKDIPELCGRIRDAWAQRDFTPSRNLAWHDCFLFAIAVPQSPEYLIADFNDGIRALSNGLRTIDEVVPLTDPPVYEVQGPLAMVRWKKARLRMGENWHTIEGLDVAVQRDGLWRCAVSIDGDWKMTPEDRYDPNNSDHVALQRLLDQGGEAMVRKDAEALRDLTHPDARNFPGGPVVARQTDFTDEVFANSAIEKHQHTIRAVKVQGPLAVTLAQLDHVEAGRSSTQQGRLNIYARTNEGWRLLVWVAGDWNKVLMADSEK